MSVTARGPRTPEPERDAKEAPGTTAMEAAEERAAGVAGERAADTAGEPAEKAAQQPEAARQPTAKAAAKARPEATVTTAEAPCDSPATRLFGPRGRHRRPRPRKVLLAAGGLALAAGALSLVRMSPDSGVSGLGATESDPAPAPGTDAEPDRSTNAAATLTPNAPKATPSATSAMGGLGTAPTTDSIVVPTPARTATTAPHGPGGAPAPTPPSALPGTQTPEPSTTTPRATAPAPETPGRPPTTPPPTQQPQPDDNSVCIPIIGLCVDPLPLDD